jgi:hypothetical protein
VLSAPAHRPSREATATISRPDGAITRQISRSTTGRIVGLLQGVDGQDAVEHGVGERQAGLLDQGRGVGAAAGPDLDALVAGMAATTRRAWVRALSRKGVA